MTIAGFTRFYRVNMPDDRLADAAAATRRRIRRLLPLTA